jgi:hypothetical protein
VRPPHPWKPWPGTLVEHQLVRPFGHALSVRAGLPLSGLSTTAGAVGEVALVGRHQHLPEDADQPLGLGAWASRSSSSRSRPFLCRAAMRLQNMVTTSSRAAVLHTSVAPSASNLARYARHCLNLPSVAACARVLQPVELAAPSRRVDQQQPLQSCPLHPVGRAAAQVNMPPFTSVRIADAIASSVV